jgi:polar amino acid transport system substrate-binding protein
LGVEVEFNDFAFNGLLDALQLGQFDAAIAAISVTPDRKQVVDFTNMYFVGDDAALARSGDASTYHSATDFSGKKVGVEEGTTYQNWAQISLVDAEVIPQDNLKTYTDNNAMIRDLRNGAIDVALMGRLPAIFITTRAQDLKIAGQGVVQQRIAIALRKGSSLTNQLNDAMIAMQVDGTYSQLASQYLNIAQNAQPSLAIPTLIENPTITETQQTAPAAPPPCLYGMTFVQDLNLNDQNMTAPPVMQPGQSFVKSWRVRNSGTCNWTPDFALVYISGNRPEAAMGAQPVSVGTTVAPGQTIDLSASLIAPTTYGTFQAFWQMRDNTGKLFGEVVWVGIQVPNPNPPTPVPAPPTPPPPAGLDPNLRADSNYITAGECTTIRWDVGGVQAVYLIDNGNQQGVGGHDARSVCPTQTTTYTLRVVQTNGVAVDFPITINVSGTPPSRPGPSITKFSVDHNSVGSGQCVNFKWETSNADGVNLYRSNNRIVDHGPTNGSKQDCPPDGTWDYRLEAFGNGNTSKNISVSVSGRSRDQ